MVHPSKVSTCEILYEEQWMMFDVTNMSDNTEAIYKAFAGSEKPLKAGEVAEITGIDKTEVSKVIKILRKEGKLISPKNCYYAPS
jgi:predicted transcriptional regulator